jgi:site-specific DNA recombinase
MRAHVYLRNSSDRQAKAATIDAQRPDCAALARQLGAVEVVEYTEEGVSGAASLDDRPAMRRLLGAVAAGDVVVSFALDRLSRSDDEIDRAAIYGGIRRAGARVETVLDGAVDTSTFGGRVLHAIRQEAAAEERRKILERTASGKRNALAEGRKPQGADPYGLRWSKDRRAWEVDAAQADVVREIYRRILAGETTGQIAADLARRGAPHPRSDRWSSARVWRIATRTACRGEWSFDGRLLTVPAIIDPATWQAVQAQLLAAQRRGLRRTQHPYFLDDGTGRCGYCGGPMRVRWSGGERIASYYLCPSRACGNRWRRTEPTDREVWERAVRALRQPGLVAVALAGANAARADGEAGEREAVGYERRIARLDEIEAANLARNRRGLISDAALDRECEAIARERAVLTRSVEAAREAIERGRRVGADVEELQGAAERLARRLEAPGLEVRLDPEGARMTPASPALRGRDGAAPRGAQAAACRRRPIAR